CVGVCPEDAIELMESTISIIEERCTNCRKCVWACPWEVIEFHREGGAHLPKEITLG
ncbi:MAG: 4Fe-4S dicluster domain-containing protein, partial [Ignavibacteriales bacterium]|nr:4Fe-4S dicluster domain-containing protein [Ignavibacteriales bacterium]